MNPVTDPALLALLEGDGQQAGPVYGPPPKAPAPPSLAELARVDISRENLQLQKDKFAYEQAKDGADKETVANNDADIRAKLIATVGKLGSIGLDAKDSWVTPGFGETGWLGSKLRDTGGTAAYSLGQDLDTAKARFAFDALQAMRDASKTGGALGQVTERELKLLEAATAAIDPNMDHETFMRNIEEARQAYLSKLAMIDPQIATRMGYDSKKAEDAWIKYNDSYAQEMGYVDEQPIDRTPNPGAMQTNPEDIDAILAKYGVQ